MTVLIFDLRDSNIVDEYETRADALAFVRETIEQYGREAVASWSLEYSDRSALPTDGEQLICEALPIST